jgi:glycosyltransferase involved in cell wall biosynthesis
MAYPSIFNTVLTKLFPKNSNVPSVILGATCWSVNGVNVFSANLVRGLNAAGMRAFILLTEEDTDLISIQERPLPKPPDVPFVTLPVRRWHSWGAHWGALIRFLEENAPCIYIPNSDWHHSCIAPLLPDNVLIIGIAHSDDPLHYDHIQRLGPYLNGMVAVSNTVLARSLGICPSLAGRATVIPIGVKVPATLPQRSAARPEKLRLIYHGILKRHQKRVLDLPLIVAAALDLGIPVELTIAGAGPDEDTLRAAAQPLVDRGAIRFTGVIGHDALGPLLEEHLVYLLPSEFEGMPNALLEAMAHACVPVVSRMSSGISEVIRDGENGYLAPCGDPAAFARCLLDFWNAGPRQQQMAAAAYKTIAAGVYTVDAMVNSYIDLFRSTARQSFVRPRGMLSPPPETVGGVNIFPVHLPHHEPGIGSFPSPEAAEDFHRQRRRISRTTSGGELTAVVAIPFLARNGISIFAEDLVRGLRKEGTPARLLLTEENTPLVHVDDPRQPRPADIPIDELSLTGPETWGRRWGAMQSYLQRHAPCVYLPSFDWRHSCIVPRLPDNVFAVGLIHSADEFYFDYLRRLGPYFNAVVATDRSIGSRLRTAFPELASRFSTIPCRMDLPDFYPRRTHNPGGLRVLIGCPVNVGHSRSPDPVKLAAVLAEHGISARFTCVRGLLTVSAGWSETLQIEEPTRIGWLALYESHDAIVTEIPRGAGDNNVWEAMARGCVPILTGGDAPGILVTGQTGFHVSSDPHSGTAAILVRLACDPAYLDTISRSGFELATRRIPRQTDTIDEYLDLFGRMRDDLARGIYRRPRGPIQVPPASIGGIDVFPVTATHNVAGIGPFPTKQDFRGYRAELKLKKPYRRRL